MDNLQANDYNQTVSAKVASYVLVAADKGTRITMSNAGATTITVNTSLFAAGDTLFITNIGAGASTITAGTATVSTASSLVLAQYDSGRLYFTSTGVAIWEKYQGASSAGKILQVVAATTTTPVANSTSTYADTTLTASITCSATTSKVLVMITQNGLDKSAGNASNSVKLQLVRPGGNTLIAAATGLNSTASIANFSAALTFLDSPASISALTYKTQFANYFNGSLVDVQGNNEVSSIILMEIGV
jgi:hypothetical protein